MSARIRHRFVDGRELKRCSHCLEWKPLSAFNMMRASWDDFQRWCKVCLLEYRNPRREAMRVAGRERYHLHPEKTREWMLKSNYGMSLEDYATLLSSQDNKCIICGTEPEPNTDSFPVDHDHVTGIVRGILCLNCNRGLGHFQDDPEILRAAAIYLDRSGEESE